MTQGAAQGPFSGGKPAAVKPTSPSKGTSPGASVGPQGVAKAGIRPATPSGAAGGPSAPKAQPRPVAAPAVKPAAPAPPVAAVRRTLTTTTESADSEGSGEVTLVEPVPAAVARLAAAAAAAAATTPSSGTLVASQTTPRPAAGVPSSPAPRDELVPVVRAMVDQAMMPLERSVRSMVEQATAPLERTMRAMVEQAMAPLQSTVRAAVEQAIEPLDRTVRDMERRLGEVERRSVPAPVVVAPPMPALPQFRPAQPVYAPPRAEDAAVIQHVSIGPELRAFDGRRRRTRLVFAIVVGCVVVFAGLVAALVQSYSNAHG